MVKAPVYTMLLQWKIKEKVKDEAETKAGAEAGTGTGTRSEAVGACSRNGS